MIYLDNKYTNYYFKIINNARNHDEIDDHIYELHHIIPRSLGGSDEKSNIVKLTLREHYICHRLLTKMTQGNDRKKMSYALWIMTACRKYRTSSRVYEYVRTDHISQLKGIPRSFETRQKIGQAHRGMKRSKETRQRMSDTHKGRKVSDETKEKLSNLHKGISKPKTEAHKQALREAAQNRKRSTCPHCQKEFTPGNFKRWHGDNCKNRSLNNLL